MPIRRGPEQRLVFFDRAAAGQLAERAGLFRVLVGDAVEELLGLVGEERYLLLLDEHREHRRAFARLDHERARAGLAEGAGADRVDRIELDGVGLMAPLRRRVSEDEVSAVGFRAGASGSRSARPPVSLHFTSSTP